MEGGGTHHVVGFERGSEYSEEDGRLSSLISEHIHPLRKLLGDSLDTLYEEEFGNTFDAEEESGGKPERRPSRGKPERRPKFWTRG